MVDIWRIDDSSGILVKYAMTYDLAIAFVKKNCSDMGYGRIIHPTTAEPFAEIYSVGKDGKKTIQFRITRWEGKNGS